MTELATLLSIATFGVACAAFGLLLAGAIDRAIQRRRHNHTHAPEQPWPTRPLRHPDHPGVHYDP